MNLNRFINSSLGRKTVMAATGLFLVVFLIEHLYGNLLLYAGDGGEAFNEYSHTLSHSLFIRIVEIFLFISIILHVVQAIYLTKQNADARPVNYAMYRVNETSNWFSRNMGLTGSLIFVFLVLHMRTFFFPYRVTGEVENLALSVQEAFSTAWYSGLYVIAMLVLAFHLNHGFQSAFRTLGLSNKAYAPVLQMASTAFAVLIFIGFSSFPILFYFKIVTL